MNLQSTAGRRLLKPDEEAALAARLRAVRDQGVTIKALTERFGISRSYAKKLLQEGAR